MAPRTTEPLLPPLSTPDTQKVVLHNNPIHIPLIRYYPSPRVSTLDSDNLAAFGDSSNRSPQLIFIYIMVFGKYCRIRRGLGFGFTIMVYCLAANYQHARVYRIYRAVPSIVLQALTHRHRYPIPDPHPARAVSSIVLGDQRQERSSDGRHVLHLPRWRRLQSHLGVLRPIHAGGRMDAFADADARHRPIFQIGEPSLAGSECRDPVSPDAVLPRLGQG